MQSARVSRRLHSSRYTKLRAALIRARLDAGLTQVVLADRLQRPQSFVSKFETGERHLDVLEFVELCEAIGVDPRKVIGHAAG